MYQVVPENTFHAPPRRSSRRLPGILTLLTGGLFWLPMVAFSLLIIVNTLPYYSFSGNDSFFLERPHAAPRLPSWRFCFYIHVAGGMLCLLAAPLQFSRTLLRRAPAVHRRLGRAYVFGVLVLTAPTGLYLAFFAKGGAPGRIGFAVQGVLLFYATWLGLSRILEGRVEAHKTWMIRSYAVAATAISFRLWYVALWYLGVSIDIYVAAIWLSTVTNLALCETSLSHSATKIQRKVVPA